MRVSLPFLTISLAAGLCVIVAAAPSPEAAAPPASAGVAYFESKVRPILAQRCFTCHSSQAKNPQGGLLLDTRFGWEHGGLNGPAIVPGDPDKSLLVRALRGQQGVQVMPPTGKLPQREIDTLVEWIRLGAPDPRTGKTAAAPKKRTIDLASEGKHWAYKPLTSPKPPAVKLKGWVRTPVDAFVLARMEGAGLRPNPAADRRTLIRRAYLDLIGLPPTPEQVDAFLADKSPEAWSKVVDSLLASPHYGERWGRHWLDLARYAESHGFEHDYDRPNAYHYRDFVIKALNQDVPYNDFVRWQLAGDEIAPENPLAMAATGFLAAGVHSTQITKNQVEKERYDELDDMLSTTGTAMLGLTFGCARCHDHKFDPIPQADYYRLLSTFTTTVRSDYDIDVDPEGYKRDKATWDQAHAPLVAARERYEREELPARMNAALIAWQKSSPATLSAAPWVLLDAMEAKATGGTTLTPQPDGSYLAGGANPDNDTYTFTAKVPLARITGVRLEALSHPSLVKGGPGRAANGNFALSEFTVTATPMSGGAVTLVRLIEPKADFEQSGLPIAAAIDGNPTTGWAIDPQFGKDHAASFRFAAPVEMTGGALLTFTLSFKTNTAHTIARPRLSVTGESEVPTLTAPSRSAEVEAALAVWRSGGSVSEADTAALSRWYRSNDSGWVALDKAVQEHLAKQPKPRLQKMLISSEGVPALRLHTQGGDFLEQTHFLRRGDPNQKQEVAQQGFLQVLMRSPSREKTWQEAPPKGWHTTYQRRNLATWMTDVDRGAGSLLARVIVNRVWQHHFGRGIVATASDFGKQGEKPTHPEMLDWLAGRFAESPKSQVPGPRGDGAGNRVLPSANETASRTPNTQHLTPGLGWSLKALHRLLLTSAAYTQSSVVSAEKRAKDPANKLVTRFAERRLEAEIIRDSMLAVSGKLDPTPFGPGSLDEAMNRRSIYFTVKRSRLVPTMILFDAPDALQGLGSRATTTIAPQALLLLNNTQVEERARALAKRAAPSPETPQPEAVRRAYLLALSRPPTAQEAADANAFLESQLASYRTDGKADARDLALADFCQVILGLNEFIFVR